ncbi:cyclic-AMP phosphodiesterase [Cantharellus anzutake]|uniref:cyclic-AMP phosphodiesterase n=1 Tax=Cantharellus anzutake TaxID=1750568 RepID=UPI00190578B1|nr:cyclic-AMP phosphodiesterase [Cantharellus anzutake]KAF8337618.1 cyclic-AMP phosphodiesterase [Cantharellus anzutake]
MSFDLVVLGCGGGPDELNLSSYLFKTCQNQWCDGILSVEAGSGLGALRELLSRDPFIFEDLKVIGKDDLAEKVLDDGSPSQRAARIYSWIRTFLISHAHLDHVCGLIIGAGSTSSSSPRYIAGTETVVRDIDTVFGGQKLWPKLASRYESPASTFGFIYNSLSSFGPYHSLSPNISVLLLPITHGMVDGGTYESTAFFIRNDTTLEECLFFGDVEPDSISSYPQTLNVWRTAAPKIRDGMLSHIFLECSWTSARPIHLLFGHLSPPHILDELMALAREVVSVGRHSTRKILDSQLEGILRGVTLVIIHCKEPITPSNPESDIVDVIVGEVKKLVYPARLGVSVIGARQGMKLRF